MVLWTLRVQIVFVCFFFKFSLSKGHLLFSNLHFGLFMEKNKQIELFCAVCSLNCLGAWQVAQVKGIWKTQPSYERSCQKSLGVHWAEYRALKTGRTLSNTTHWPIESNNDEFFTKNPVIDIKMLLTYGLYLYAALLWASLCYHMHFMCAYTMLIKVIIFNMW